MDKLAHCPNYQEDAHKTILIQVTVVMWPPLSWACDMYAPLHVDHNSSSKYFVLNQFVRSVNNEFLVTFDVLNFQVS